MADWKFPHQLLDYYVSQDTLHCKPGPVRNHSATPPPLPHQLTINNGHVPRRVHLGLSRVGKSTVNPKIAIPRSTHVERPGKARARQACKHCREQKAKCTGDQPCQRCCENGENCIYELRKRDFLNRRLAEVSVANQLYQDLIHDLYPKLDDISAQKAKQVLRGPKIARPAVRSSFPGIRPLNSSFTLVQRLEGPTHEAKVGDAQIKFQIKDSTDEDFNSSQRMQAMGIVGEHSATAWLFELKRNLVKESGSNPSDRTWPLSISAMSYFENEINIEIHDSVELWVRPPRKVADQLVDSYLRNIHPEFPVIGKITFCWQYQSYFSNSNARPGRRWVALLNLVWAIAAKVTPLVIGHYAGSSEHHAIYFARAWQLSIDHVALADHPDLQQVQVEGLTAFYLLCVGEINRAWRMLGTAIQSALAMGINLRNAADEVPFSSKEIRYRVWWALFVLDSSLQVITGRPSHINTNFCTTPLPIPYREEDFLDSTIRHVFTDTSARNHALLPFLLLTGGASDGMKSWTIPNRIQTAGLVSNESILKEQAKDAVAKELSPATPKVSPFFLHAVELAYLTHKVIETLYSPQQPERSPSDLEILISNLNASTDQWLLQLPGELNFTTSLEMQRFSHQSVSLGFRFYAAKIFISKPCLHKLAYKSTVSDPARSFYRATADICVRAACQMLDLLPTKIDLAWPYGSTPCWLVLHYIMLSIAVLTIRLFMYSEAKSSEESRVIEQIQKALRWLRSMAVNDPSAGKAWRICIEILSQHESMFSPVMGEL